MLVSSHTPKEYDPTKHKWLMALDVERCIGCGLCVEACKTENAVPAGPSCFRAWIERYIITKPEPGSGEMRGETLVDSPNGGMHGFPPSLVPKEQILTELLHERRRWCDRLVAEGRLEEHRIKDEWEGWKGIARGFGCGFFGVGVILLVLILYAMTSRLTH
jgi:ferredoxin